MMDYRGGDLLLAGAACGRLLGQCTDLCLQAVGSDLKQPGGSVSVTKSALEVSIHDTCYTNYIF